MGLPDISVVIPAHNEEDYLPKCLAAISKSAQLGRLNVETVVVLNRCTDETEEIAAAFGAILVYEDAKNIARIRNAGITASTGSIVVTIDADSYLSEETFCEIAELLKDQAVMGGGADFKPERRSLAILLSYGVAKWIAKRVGASMALYWVRRDAFDAIGGFDESLRLGEDIDFSSRLRLHAKDSEMSYMMLKRSHAVTSCRKFDQFGDWYAIKLALFESRRVKSMMAGTNESDMDTYYYETRSGKSDRQNF